MTKQKLKHILCAVRGQPESRATVTRAIDLALEYEARLTFLLVIDIQFLAQAAPTMTPLQLVYRQMEDLGEFSMLILCDRAQRRGVTQADYIIRKGNIPKKLLETAASSGADLMVLGSPMRDTGRNIFTPEEFAELIQKIEQVAKIEVVQVG
jgi:nucleotide-binding universal stress UspA family protein